MTTDASTTIQPADLCMALIRADSEVDVITILKDAGYWDDPTAWRLFSDNENNYSVIGNQQGEAVAAFVEKITNSVDARLVNACRLAGDDPEAADAPQSMREAIARYFEEKSSPKEADGRISDWADSKATAEGRLLTVAATGYGAKLGQPCLTVADQGEGQTPDEFPNTFMSLQKSNKLRIPFVQGKFNMGGTGALNFCKFQLVVSRRSPGLLGTAASERDKQWGFTIVRREPPSGGTKSSVFKYLAPVVIDGQDRRGVLAFSADDWPILPEANKDVRDAYYRGSPYGSMIKLYEYTWQGTKSNIVWSGDGLLRRIDIGLPELALPVRVFECRKDYGGGAGSFATNALGLVARLDRDREGNLEGEKPIGGVIALDDGKQIRLRVYAFKPDKAKQYRNVKHGVVFGVNGQMHAAYHSDLFKRQKVGLSYLADSLLVFADCTAIDGQTREDLFMNSRDRIRDTALSRQLESKLESFLRGEPTLRALHTQRRQESIQDKLKDDKPLSDVLQKLMKNNSILSRLFLQGLNLSSPFPPGGGEGTGKPGTSEKFVGKRFPTVFRFKDRKDGDSLTRDARIGTRTRVAFETDAEDSYFVRDLDPGAWNVRRMVDGVYEDAAGWITTGPKDGIAQLWFDSLPEGTKVGDTLEYLVEVTDASRIDAFELKLVLRVMPASNVTTSGTSGQSKTANKGAGSAGGSGTTLSLPDITLVHEADWGKHEGFDELSALKVVHAGTPGDVAAPVYDFFINVDNKFLRHSQKDQPSNADLLEKQFVYGFVLVGLALLQNHKQRGANEDGEDVEAYVLRTTRALASILVPMIQAVGGLAGDDA